MKKLFNSLLCAFCIATFICCSDDKSEDIPPVLTDFLVANTNENGIISTVTLDDGALYDVQRQNIATNLKDTLFRCLASYTLAERTLSLYSINLVVSAQPCPPEDFWEETDEALPRDPMNVISMWKSGGYINMQLGLLTTGLNGHQYGFCEDSVGHYSLVHLRPEGDRESYTQKVYLSMPIPDSVSNLTFSVYTYNGIYTRKF